MIDALSLIFDAIDSDKDGGICKTEFSTYFKSLNISDVKAAEQVFAAIDDNADGYVSKDGKNTF